MFSQFPKVALLSLFLLAACESAEERAERFYQSAVTLIEEGDVDRAIVELRNALKLNEQHFDARLALADLQRERGALPNAYANYLRLSEEFPDAPQPRLAMGEIAILTENWQGAVTQGREAYRLAPDDIRAIAVNALLDYRDAALAQDAAAAEEQITIAGTIIEQTPDNIIARKMLIDDAISDGNAPAALNQIDTALGIDPLQGDLHMLKLGLLRELGEPAPIEAQLEEMTSLFPDERDLQQLLISWYVNQGKVDQAENYLRDLVAKAEDQPDAWLVMVEFIKRQKGFEAARAEVARLMSEDPDNDSYRAVDATIAFELGQTDEAIAQMNDILNGADDSEPTRGFKIVLARMWVELNDAPKARQLVDEVLDTDPSHVEALKMRAIWQMEDDLPGEAIITLRAALAEAPDDGQIVTMMGDAHLQQGEVDIAGERYASAVDLSDKGAPESLRYARFLINRGRLDAAETVLTAALKLAPVDVPLLETLAEVKLGQGDRNTATRIMWRLLSLDDEEASAAANKIKDAMSPDAMAVQETVGFIQSLLNGQGAEALTPAQAREARTFIADQLAIAPDEPRLLLLQAALDDIAGDTDAAEATYRQLAAANPDELKATQALYTMLMEQGRMDDARTVVEDALALRPDALVLQFMLASHHETVGNYEAAIAIYEALHANDATNLVIANNLASLISTHRNTREDIARAAEIAEVLQDATDAPFQDTYGWIAHLRGDNETAISYLENAVAGLPDDSLIRYRLGVAYAAANRNADARSALTASTALAGNADLPHLQEAAQLLENLPAD